MLNKNDLITLEITDMTAEGNGVGRQGGMAVFVPFAAPGDTLKVRIVKVLKSFCYGKLEKILTPSPSRIAPDCPAFGRCGGCVFRHLSYDMELTVKEGWVRENLRRIGGIQVEMPPILPSPQVDRYRNKAQIPLGQGEDGPFCGFYAGRSHRIAPCDDCLLQPEEFSAITQAVLDFARSYRLPVYDEETGTGLLRHIYLRKAQTTGEIMLCLVATANRLPHSGQLVSSILAQFPQVTTMVLNLNRSKTNVILGRDNIVLSGKGMITDNLCGVDVDISPLSFYQVNHGASELLYREAARMAGLTGSEVLLDLYCGTGTIGLSMAKSCSRLIGVEVVQDAVNNALQNATRMGLTNAQFLCGDAGQAAAQLAKEGVQPDVVIVDPPRKGCEPEALEAICQMAPARIVMISCNSATAARDLKYLESQGYRTVEAQAVDMFPRTAHVECVVLLTR